MLFRSGIKQLTENPNHEASSNGAQEKEEKDSKVKKVSAKKENTELKDGGTTSLGALLKAKLDDKK